MTVQDFLRLVRLYSKKITELPEATTPLAGSEKVEIVQDGINKQVDSSFLGGGATGSAWVHKGDWDLSSDTLPAGATDYNTYMISVEGFIDFGLGQELVPAGSLIFFVGGDNQDGTNWRLL